MPTRFRRYPLKPKEAKTTLINASQRLKIDLERVVGDKSKIEAAEMDFGQFLLIDGKPFLFKVENSVLPTLLFSDVLSRLPRIIVDMGAVPHLCNGADLMAPGIVRVEGEFRKGDLVLVVDVKHGKSLALMEILHDSVDFPSVRKGIVAKSIHYVGDRYWDSAKRLIT